MDGGRTARCAWKSIKKTYSGSKEETYSITYIYIPNIRWKLPIYCGRQCYITYTCFHIGVSVLVIVKGGSVVLTFCGK